MKNNTILSLEEMSQKMQKAFKEVEGGIKEGKLSKDEKKDILLELEKGMFKIYQYKVDIKMEELKSTSPDMPVRDVLINLLGLLKPETSARVTAMVTNYIFQKWEKNPLKIAA